MPRDDLRTVHWHEIASQDWLTDLRLRCYLRLLQSPATPDEIADEFRLSILSVRPRCAELRNGLPRHVRNPLILAAATGERRGGAHVLRAIPYQTAQVAWKARAAAHQPGGADPRGKVSEAARTLGRQAHSKPRESCPGQLSLLSLTT